MFIKLGEFINNTDSNNQFCSPCLTGKKDKLNIKNFY